MMRPAPRRAAITLCALFGMACSGPGGGPAGGGTSPRAGGDPGRAGTTAPPRTPASADFARGVAALSRLPPDHRAALAAFAQALKAHGKHRPSRLNAAYCLLRLGRLTEAEAAYRAAQRPGDREALLGWVDTLLRLRRPAPAVTALRAWVKERPKDLQALGLLAEAHRRARAPDLALSAVQQALTFDRKDPGAHLQFGRLYLDRKDARTALMIFNRGLRYHPRHALLHLARAEAWLTLGEMGRAVMDLEAAVKLDGQLVTGRLRLGKVYVDNLDYKGAERHFKAVLSGWPQHLEAQLGLARALYGQKRFKDALAAYQAVLRDHGDAPRALSQVGKIYQDHLDSPREALIYYRKFVRARPGLPTKDPVFATIRMLESMTRAPRRRPPAPRPPTRAPRAGGARP